MSGWMFRVRVKLPCDSLCEICAICGQKQNRMLTADTADITDNTDESRRPQEGYSLPQGIDIFVFLHHAGWTN
jgi:hypothetical protein